MLNITIIRDYNKEYNIKFNGLKIIDVRYENGKVVSIKERNKNKNLLKSVEKFKSFYKIQTDDVITIIDMYFANEFSVEYIGKSIFD